MKQLCRKSAVTLWSQDLPTTRRKVCSKVQAGADGTEIGDTRVWESAEQTGSILAVGPTQPWPPGNLRCCFSREDKNKACRLLTG